jgi:hypothetical protein
MVTQYTDIPFEIFTIDNLYTNYELSIFYNYVKDADSNNRPFTMSNFKNGKVIKPDWSSFMYERIKPYLPRLYQDRSNTLYSFKEPIKYIMYAAINENQQFPIHTDTGYEYDDQDSKYSKYTVLTYLNDDFEGGNTLFFDDNFKQIVQIMPKRGRTLIFDIDLFHSGEKVTKYSKYWIGTELVCTKLNTT